MGLEKPPDPIAVALAKVGAREADAVEFAGAFPVLDDGQLAKLRPYGTDVEVKAGEVLFREGQRDVDCVVVLSGHLEAIAHYGASGDPVSTPFSPGQFVGVMNILSSEGAYVTLTAVESSRVLRIPMDRLRHVIDTDVTLSEIFLRAFLLRHSLLMRLGTGPKVIGSRYSSATRHILDLLARNRITVTFIDVESNATAEGLLRGFGLTVADTPVVLVAGQPILKHPTLSGVAEVFGISPSRSPQEDVCDLVVVGAGPGGLAAAVYGGSEGLSTTVVESVAIGGQAGMSSRIENYLGFPAGLSGQELAARAALQAQKFAAAIVVGSPASTLTTAGGIHTVGLADGRSINARAVVIATGARYRRLDVPRLSEFEGAGVYYAATEVEARTCSGGVAIVGGGNSAGQAAIFMAQKGLEVHLLIRGKTLLSSMSRYLIDEIEREPAIKIHYTTQVRELIGEHNLEAIAIQPAEGERTTLEVCAVFSFIGAEPNSDWLDGVQKDQDGFIRTGPEVASTCLLLETNIPGVFAVGDVRSGSIKRVATAVGEGSMVVRLVHERRASPAFA